MKRRTTIAVRHMPPTLPIMSTIVVWLLLDRLGVASWGWGVFWTIAVLVWLGAIVDAVTATRAEPRWESYYDV